MLVLNLRKEFQDHRLRGTAIELVNENNTGATHGLQPLTKPMT